MSRPDYARTASTDLSAAARSKASSPSAPLTSAPSPPTPGIGVAICRNLAAKGSTQRTAELAAQTRRDARHPRRRRPGGHGLGDGARALMASARDRLAHPTTGAFTLDIQYSSTTRAWRTTRPLAAVDVARLYDVKRARPAAARPVQTALPHLPHDRSGRIVNVTSGQRRQRRPGLCAPGQSVYGGTKAARRARGPASSAGRCTVNPGPVATDTYRGTSADFQAQMSACTKNAPLARGREGGRGCRRVCPPTIPYRDCRRRRHAAYRGCPGGARAAWVCANGGFKSST
ncbi:hypothetical protein BJ546DRAFT_1027836 [Cryomyces antarcticus]